MAAVTTKEGARGTVRGGGRHRLRQHHRIITTIAAITPHVRRARRTIALQPRDALPEVRAIWIHEPTIRLQCVVQVREVRRGRIV